MKKQLQQHRPGLTVKLIGMQTQGDKILDKPLSIIGGKSLFTKELELALHEHRADIAVHSMKDVTIDMPDGLSLPAILKRDNVQDVFISAKFKHINDLPENAVIGTSSPRRACQLKNWRRDIQIKELRGNVGTRLQKLHRGEYDAIILAAAGIKRLGLTNHINEFISTDLMLPAAGQGAIGVQMRTNDDKLEVVYPLNDPVTQQQIEAERVVSAKLFGNCRLPIAAYGELSGQNMKLHGMVGRADGSEIIRDSVSGKLQYGKTLGLKLADALLQKGADKILQEYLHK